MAQKVNPIAVRLNFNRFSDSSWFSDYYYSTLLYQDLNFRQYLSSIKHPNANKLGFRAAKCIIHHFPKRSLIHLFCLSDPRKKDPFPVPRDYIGPSPLRALVNAIPGEGTRSASEDRVTREARLGLTTSDVHQLGALATESLEQLSVGYTERREGGERAVALAVPSTVSSPDKTDSPNKVPELHPIGRRSTSPFRVDLQQQGVVGGYPSGTLSPIKVDSLPPSPMAPSAHWLKGGPTGQNAFGPLPDKVDSPNRVDLRLQLRRRRVGSSAEGCLTHEEKPFVGKNAETLRCASSLGTSEKKIRTLGPLGVRPYWFKSSILQKKKALVNLHRGVVESLSQVSSAPPREQRLVSYSSRLSFDNGPLAAWYRKTRAKKSRHAKRQLGSYHAAMMLTAFPRVALPFLGGPRFINKGAPALDTFNPLKEGAPQSKAGAQSFEPEAVSPVGGARGSPQSRCRRSHNNDTLWSVLAQFQKGRHTLLGGLPGLGGPLATDSIPKRVAVKGPVFTGQGEDPSIGLDGRESILVKLRHGSLRAHYFNFYALHYYFMLKMGDSLGRLPLRLNRSPDLLRRHSPQGAPASILGKANDNSTRVKKIGASWFRHSVYYKNSSKALAVTATYAGSSLLSPWPQEAGPKETLQSRAQSSPQSWIQGSQKFLQANYLYLWAQTQAGINAEGLLGRCADPVGPLHKGRAMHVDPNYGWVGHSTTTEPSGFFFGSSSCNHITKSLDFYLSNVHSILSQNTKTFISLRPIKVHSVFQCASLVAQEVACKLEQKKSFRLICRLIFQQLAVCNYIKGIRITCSGRLNGAEIAKTECRKFGETSLHVFSDKIDYARAEASTPYGILGVKVWISYI